MSNQKEPKDRQHLWEHKSDVADPPAAIAPVVYADYPHALPRHVHNDQCESRLVETPEACEAALEEGFAVVPVGQALYKDADTITVYSASAKAQALSDGYALEAPIGESLDAELDAPDPEVAPDPEAAPVRAAKKKRR